MPTRPSFRYVHVASFRAVHHLTAIGNTAPEARTHGHHYRVEVGFEGAGVYGVGYAPGETEDLSPIDGWLDRFWNGSDLAVQDFETTPARLAAYLFDVWREQYRDMRDVTLIIDGGDRVTYREDPA